jgi:sugar diacid utilization regulator
LQSSHHNRETADDVAAAAAALARVASSSDQPQDLLECAGAELGRPLGLAGPNGDPVASSSRDDVGAAAIAIACSAADGASGQPAGWTVVPVDRFGHLAVGPAASGMNGSPAFVDLLRSLLAAQLQRTRLRDEERAKRRGTLVRRLVCGREVDVMRANREAASIGVQLAELYRAALLVWADRADGTDALRSVQIEAARRDSGWLTLPLEGRLLLLHPDRDEPADYWLRALERLVSFARRSSSGSVQAVAGRATVTLAELPAMVEQLLGLSTVMNGASHDERLVLCAEQFGLERLLREGLEARAAAAFVEAELGALIAWDARCSDDLLAVLEAALDCANYGEAAGRCFMHRNTFRQHLRRACELLGQPLEDPHRRLSLHVALKLRRLLGGTDRPHTDSVSNSTSERAPRGARVNSSTFRIARSGTMTARGARRSPSVGTRSS